MNDSRFLKFCFFSLAMIGIGAEIGYFLSNKANKEDFVCKTGEAMVVFEPAADNSLACSSRLKFGETELSFEIPLNQEQYNYLKEKGL